MTIRYKLSKSRFLSGFQCQKKLWLEKHHPELKAVTPDSQQAILDQGTRVGELAREQFRDGVLIEADYDEIPLALKQTRIVS